MERKNKKLDHREIGKKLDLFLFNETAPGAVFWLPKGWFIFQKLSQFLRKLYRQKGYSEINTPVLVNKKLWEKSGHWGKFRENMFTLKDGGQTYSLKPMNCPESALVYESKIRSFRDLPLRIAEQGVLHRNEISGSLGGLFRVRQMTMDDAHIYVRPDQLQKELSSIIEQILLFHKLFNFNDAKFFIGTKPTKSLGSAEIWDRSIKALKTACKKFDIKYKLKEKDGAFYGPKLDINVQDSQKREWTLSTVQIDFNIPERFNLKYTDKDGSLKTPIIIHRSILGTFERFIGILLEHTQGKLPSWIAPIQVRILPLSEKFLDLAQKIAQKMEQKSIRVEIDESNESVAKKVRNAEIAKIPFYIVLGQKEKNSGKISVTDRDKKTTDLVTVEKLIKTIKTQELS